MYTYLARCGDEYQPKGKKEQGRWSPGGHHRGTAIRNKTGWGSQGTGNRHDRDPPRPPQPPKLMAYIYRTILYI